jgi:hypothetical protein
MTNFGTTNRLVRLVTKQISKSSESVLMSRTSRKVDKDSHLGATDRAATNSERSPMYSESLTVHHHAG